MDDLSQSVAAVRSAFATSVVILSAAASASAQPPGRSYPAPAVRGPVPAVVARRVFGSRAETARLAEQMSRQANALCVEMHKNYGHARGFRETYREMYSVLEDAKRVRDLANQGYHRGPRNKDDKIARELHDMDRRFHNVEDDLRRWMPVARSGHDQRTLARRLDSFEDTLHDLMEDYGERSGLGQARQPGPPRR